MTEVNSDPYKIRILSFQVPEKSNASTSDS